MRTVSGTCGVSCENRRDLAAWYAAAVDGVPRAYRTLESQVAWGSHMGPLPAGAAPCLKQRTSGANPLIKAAFAAIVAAPGDIG